MRKAAITILVFILLAGVAQAQNWATVDSRLLIVLHPYMGNFDYSSGRFFRKNFSTERNKTLYEEINKAAKETEKKMVALVRKESGLIEKRANLLFERDQTINDLASKAASETYNIRGKYERVAEYERRFDKRLNELDRQLESLYQEMESVKDQAYAPIYLTGAETTARLIEIKRDIKSHEQTVANQYKISTVLDTSFGMQSLMVKNRNARLYLQPDNFDVLSSSLFHDLTNVSVETPPDAASIGATQEHMLLGASYAKLDVLKKIAQLKSYLIPVASEFSPGSIFLLGGNDITAHVAQKIFAQYRVPETLKASYLKIISDFENLENSQYQEIPPRYPDEAHGGIK